MNPLQKYPHIIESFACTLKMFAFMFLFPINFYFFLGYAQDQNYRNRQFHFCYKIKQSNVPVSAYSPRFIMYAASFIFLGKSSQEKTQLNLNSF